MPELPKAAVAIDDFIGLQLEVDEFQLQPGATHKQTNFISDDLGAMQTRMGYVPLDFEATVP